MGSENNPAQAELGRGTRRSFPRQNGNPTLNVAKGATFKDGAPGEGVGHSTRNQPPQGAAERYVGYGIAEAMP